jgi:hypothetical protein
VSKRITFATATRKLSAAGYEPDSYSGRGMYGKECVGVIVASYAEVARAAQIVGREPTTDSMGRGVVAYWPSIAWVDGVPQ